MRVVFIQSDPFRGTRVTADASSSIPAAAIIKQGDQGKHGEDCDGDAEKIHSENAA